MNTDVVATLVIRDSRHASQYAIVRVRNRDNREYRGLIDIMRERAPKLLNYLRENRITQLIEEMPDTDLAVDLEERINSITAKYLEPSARETMKFIGRMAKTKV